MKKSDVIALIQARGGSKGVPKKNIRDLGGFPLIAYSVVACKLAKNIERTIISTDSEEIAEIAKLFGAEVPFMRPAEFARDNSTDKEVIEHALGWFEQNENYAPEYWVQIRPTTPLRDPALLSESVSYIKSRPESTSLVSVHEIEEPPGKMFGMHDGYLQGLCPFDPRPEYFTLPRQAFPPAYFGNGYVDIIKTHTLKRYRSCYGPRMLAFMTPDTGEVDGPDDFRKLNFFLANQKHPVYDHLCSNYKNLKREARLKEPVGSNSVWSL
ncbi:MAG: acylneuraminate cytidylyltransferase family protein [Candidatus Omnitrophica bacterium]|nr:acylneuraminate cytidylyltransferase family protein [Candidatus Omnitrophota bacterium]